MRVGNCARFYSFMSFRGLYKVLDAGIFPRMWPHVRTQIHTHACTHPPIHLPTHPTQII